ncbi:MAG: hypothetical protein JW839_22575 [Candidatus Lokiarchaeota archaeon]|nr:hypothetical protein [Candidatus Lokiarchaeota archaeon]
MDLIRITFGGLSAALQCAGFASIFRNYLKKRYRPSLYMAVTWFGFMLEAAFYTAKYFFETGSDPHVFLNLLENLSLVPGFLGMLALIDSVARDAVEPRRFSIALLVLSADAMLFVFLFRSEFVFVPILVVVSIGLLFGIAWLYFCVLIFKNVPPPLKRPALINIVGAILVSIMYVVANKYVSGLSRHVPSIDRIFQSIGALMHAIIFAKYDQLFYVLPFKTQRLVTFDTTNGISLFTYTWNRPDRLIDEDLFSSMLQGVTMIVNESLKKGNVQEIKMEKGVLLINRNDKRPVASVLVASKSSRVLRDGLAAFNRQFVDRFARVMDRDKSVDGFSEAKQLVESCFSFIPSFK